MSAAEGSTGGPVARSAELGGARERWGAARGSAGRPASGLKPLDFPGRSRLLSGLVDAEAVRAALVAGGHADVRRRVLTGEVTVHAVLGLYLFSDEGYDSVLARVMPLLGGTAATA